MMPVAPTPRKASSFSIESLMGGKGRSRTPSPARVPSPTSPEPAHTPKDPRDITSGLGSSFHPVTPGSGGLHGLKAPLGDNPLATLEGLNSLHRHLGVHGPHGLHPLHGALGAHMGHPHHALPGMNPLLMGAHREMLPFYPWLMARHGNFLPHRFAGPEGFLLQPFRKPKRIRTAFSPSQLLRLEHAFEKNHYVVGQERKELAVTLSLTETQVKVWFQNRRTKYKRMKAEEGEDGTCTSDLSRHEMNEEDAEIDLESLDSDEEDPHMGTMVPDTNMDCSDTNSLSNSTHHLNRWRVDTQQV